MTTLHETPDGMVAFAKGAPEIVLASCTRQLETSGERRSTVPVARQC